MNSAFDEPIQIIFQNKDYVVVNKPYGVSVHNVEDAQNLLTLLMKQLKLPKLYPVHRLDKETSGVQILALNDSAAKTLAEKFQSKDIEKIYVGVLRGQLAQEQGVWVQPLTDKSEGRKNPAGIAKDRVPCETRFRVLQKSKYFTMCEFHLITGRQHQIRKHTALIKHGLVGDARYGDVKYNEKIANMYGDARMFLHCQRVNLLGQNLVSETPSPFAKLFVNEPTTLN